MRKPLRNRRERTAVADIQNEQRDRDREHAVAERLDPAGLPPVAHNGEFDGATNAFCRAGRTIASVAYDEDLADRIRELLAGEPGLTEKKMFGGLAFLVGGNMAVAASGQGGVLVRVDPAQSDALVATTAARPMEMRGRQMQGWLRVDSDDVRGRSQLAKWVELGATYARSLPAKR